MGAESENGDGVYKWKCDSKQPAVICEATGSSVVKYSLKKYLTNANYAGGEAERRGTEMMQNGNSGKREPINMMQNGDSGKREPTNMMQNGDSGKREPINMMQMENELTGQPT